MPEVRFLRFAAVAATFVLSACTNVPVTQKVVGALTPYRFDRVQGNVVTREQLDALKAGITRQQVRDILGTPLLTSAFRADRWDYAFTFNRQGVAPQARRISVFFNGDLLDHTEADDVPSEATFVSELRAPMAIEKLPTMTASEEKLQAFAQSNSAKPSTQGQTAVASKPAGTNLPPLPANYPPLEATR